jgi:hypothetical protein
MAAEPIAGQHITLMAFDAGDEMPGPVPCSICQICSALVAITHEGELRHLLDHEQPGQLRDG